MLHRDTPGKSGKYMYRDSSESNWSIYSIYEHHSIYVENISTTFYVPQTPLLFSIEEFMRYKFIWGKNFPRTRIAPIRRTVSETISYLHWTRIDVSNTEYNSLSLIRCVNNDTKQIAFLQCKTCYIQYATC